MTGIHILEKYQAWTWSEKQAGLQEIANLAKTFHWIPLSQVLIVCTMAMLVSGALSAQWSASYAEDNYKQTEIQVKTVIT